MINPSLFLRRAIVGDAIITGAMAVLLVAAAGFLGPLLNLPESFLREVGIFLSSMPRWSASSAAAI